MEEYPGKEPGLIVDETVIVDPKRVTAFNEMHTAQMIGYLAITGLHFALLPSSKQARLQWKRVVRRGALESTGDSSHVFSIGADARNPRLT
jgi:PD-(D/E)XK nuclease superfamily